MNKKYFLLIFFISISTSNFLKALEQIAIIFIVDQFGHRSLQKVAPYTKKGIRELLNKGVVYDNAHFIYAKTLTAPGHATLNTGVPPKTHGITGNFWINDKGERVACDYDTVEKSAIFSPEGFYTKGKSAQNLAVDGISDQVMLESTPESKNKVIAISLKSRAAIFTAGRLGKAVWFDGESGFFTSSKAYYKKLPSWVTHFNKKKSFNTVKSVMWKPCYPLKSAAYSMAKNSYDYARLPSMINKTINHNFFEHDKHKEHHIYNFLTYSPQSNKLLLDLAKECLQETLQEDPKKILLWISLSSLDKVGHIFGPDSVEYIDTVYHIDTYLKDFMDYVRSTIAASKITFVLTADHGITPLVEILQKEKFNLAYRLLENKLEQTMNKEIEKKYGIKNCIQEVYAPSVFLNQETVINTKKSTRRKILQDLKNLLKKQPGIKNAWTCEELEEQNPQPYDFTTYYKNQVFPGRSGQLIFQTEPYTYVTDDELGTGHISCYNYTTHVPLIFYQPHRTSHKTIIDRVSMTQFAPTLAKKLNVPSPSACTDNHLAF